MALSDSVITSSYEGRYYKVSWTATQSVVDNTSTISWKLESIGGSASWYAERTLTVAIAGTIVFSKTDRVQRYTGTISSGTLTVKHADNGSKSFSIDVKAAVYVSSINCTGSGTFALDDIPRKSTLSISNGTLGTSQTLSVARKSTSFTHTITYTCGNTSGTICTKSSSTSISWTPPTILAKQNTVGTSVTIKVTIKTYNGDTAIGSNTYTISCAIPSSAKPSVSISVSDDTTNYDTYGGYIRGQSKLKIVLTATLSYDSPIASYSTTVDGSNYNTSSFTTGIIKTPGSLTIEAAVKDKRGRVGTASLSIDVIDYIAPKIEKLAVRRCNEDGTENEQGGYIRAIFSASVTSLSQKNKASYKLSWKKTENTTWTDRTLSDHNNDYSVKEATSVFQADDAYSYDVRLTVTDAFTSVNVSTEASTAATIIHFPISGRGISFGKISELEDTMDVGWDLDVRENANIRKDANIHGATVVRGSYVNTSKNLLRYTSSEWSDWITPNTESPGHNCFLYYGYDLSKLLKDVHVMLTFDIEFSGVTAGTGGNFRVYSRDVTYPNATNTSGAAWGYAKMQNVMNLNSPPEDGVYHYTGMTTLTKDLSTYNRTCFIICCAYWGGGKFRIRNLRYSVSPIINNIPTLIDEWEPAPEDSIFTVLGPSLFNGEIHDVYGTSIPNGLAVYTGTGTNAIDPNTTKEHLIITDKNVPFSGFAYVITLFYSEKSATANRTQIAIPYSTTSTISYRYYYNGSWSDWQGDSGWQTLISSGTSFIKYRMKNGIVTVAGTSYGAFSLPKGDYYTVSSVLPAAYRPSIDITTAGVSRSTTGYEIQAEVRSDGNVKIYNSNPNSTVTYWGFNVTYPAG